MSNKPGKNSGIKKIILSNIETCKGVFNEFQNFKYCEKVLLLMFGIFPDGEKRSRFLKYTPNTPNTEQNKRNKIQEIKKNQGYIRYATLGMWKKTNEQKLKEIQKYCSKFYSFNDNDNDIEKKNLKSDLPIIQKIFSYDYVIKGSETKKDTIDDLISKLSDYGLKMMMITFYPLLVDSRISLNIPEDPEQKNNSKAPSTETFSDAFLNAISSSYFNAGYLKRKMKENIVELTEGQSTFIVNLKTKLKSQLNNKPNNFQKLFTGTNKTNGLFSNGLKTINFGQGFQTPLNLCIDKGPNTLKKFIDAYKQSVEAKVNIRNKDATYLEYFKINEIENRKSDIANHKLEVAINFIPGVYDKLASKTNNINSIHTMQSAMRPLCVSALGYALLTMQPIETIRLLITNGTEYHNVWDGDNQKIYEGYFYEKKKYNNDVITFIFFLLKLKYDKKEVIKINNEIGKFFNEKYNFNAYLKYLTDNWNDVDGKNQQTKSTNNVQTISLWKNSKNILKYLLSLYHEKRNVNVLGHKTARGEEVLIKSFWFEPIKTSALGLLMNLDKDIDKLNVNLTNKSTNLIKNKVALSNQLEIIILTNLNKNERKYTPKLDSYKKTRLGASSKNIELEKKNEHTAQNTDKDKLKLMINLFMNMIYRQKEIIKDEKYLTRSYRQLFKITNQTNQTNKNYENYFLRSRLRQLLPIGYSHSLNKSKLGMFYEILYILSWSPIQLHICKFAVGMAACSFFNLYCIIVSFYLISMFVYDHKDIYSLMPFVLRRTRHDFTKNISEYLKKTTNTTKTTRTNTTNTTKTTKPTRTNTTKTTNAEKIEINSARIEPGRSPNIHFGGKKKINKNVVKVSKVKKTIKKSITKKVNK
jgi:hypothetical protein